MHIYDLNVILDPNLNETQLKLEKDAIGAQIERVEGSVQEVDEWGNKRLAYPIRKLNEGYYLIYKLSLSETAPRQLTTNLRLRDNIMRVLVTRDRPEQRTRKEAPRAEVRPEPRAEPRPEVSPEAPETPAASA
jgi:small subunit ribosomal protein S6